MIAARCAGTSPRPLRRTPVARDCRETGAVAITAATARVSRRSRTGPRGRSPGPAAARSRARRRCSRAGRGWPPAGRGRRRAARRRRPRPARAQPVSARPANPSGSMASCAERAARRRGITSPIGPPRWSPQRRPWWHILDDHESRPAGSVPSRPCRGRRDTVFDHRLAASWDCTGRRGGRCRPPAAAAPGSSPRRSAPATRDRASPAARHPGTRF